MLHDRNVADLSDVIDVITRLNIGEKIELLIKFYHYQATKPTSRVSAVKIVHAHNSVHRAMQRETSTVKTHMRGVIALLTLFGVFRLRYGFVQGF